MIAGARRLTAFTPPTRLLHRAPVCRAAQLQIRRASTQADYEREAEEDLTGGYINPTREKRQFRDPYENWWDKQERRNYGEPVHEDNDILGMLSPEEIRHVSSGKAFFMQGCFVMIILGICGIVSFIYPDKPSVQRRFPGGLERELGGPNAVRARNEEDPD